WIDLQVDKSAIIKGNLQVELNRASATRPGYYGEKGRSIIQVALLATFGKTATSNSNFAPLSFVKFIEYVLVPSVAVAFIMQDRNITAMEAKLVMQRSAEYGSLMFTAEDVDVDLDHILESIYRNAKVPFPWLVY
ncbi:RTC4-like domain-containing protein, partial [Mycena floridula]